MRSEGENGVTNNSVEARKIPLVFVVMLDDVREVQRHFEDAVTDYSVWSVQSRCGKLLTLH